MPETRSTKEQEMTQLELPFQHPLIESGFYGKGHPWYYLLGGPPASFDQIPVNVPESNYGFPVERLESELSKDRVRYEELLSRGTQAIEDFDAEYCYGGDKRRALASTLAFLFTGISVWKGELQKVKMKAMKKRK